MRQAPAGEEVADGTEAADRLPDRAGHVVGAAVGGGACFDRPEAIPNTSDQHPNRSGHIARGAIGDVKHCEGDEGGMA